MELCTHTNPNSSNVPIGIQHRARMMVSSRCLQFLNIYVSHSPQSQKNVTD